MRGSFLPAHGWLLVLVMTLLAGCGAEQAATTDSPPTAAIPAPTGAPEPDPIAPEPTATESAAPEPEPTAPGAASPTGALVSQPLDPILAAPIEVRDVTDTTAVIAVETTQDVACVTVYGTDEGFGNLALDQLMGNAAHREHRVQLRGLMPDTEYLFRFQGSDPAGTFYASEILSFRTAPASASDTPGQNVATLDRGARVAEVSSIFGGGDNDSTWGANNAIDGDPSTEWSSDGDGNDAFITVELPEPVEVSGFGLWTRTMGTSAQITRFEVENEAGERFGPFDVPDAAGEHIFPASGQGQRFTFRVLESSGGNTGIVDLAVYAAGE